MIPDSNSILFPDDTSILIKDTKDTREVVANNAFNSVITSFL